VDGTNRRSDGPRWVQELSGRAGKALRFVRDVLYGYTTHELNLELRKERAQVERLFMLAVFGDLIGLPILPPYYAMRILPFIVPSLRSWKRSLLRERDLTDLATADL